MTTAITINDLPVGSVIKFGKYLDTRKYNSHHYQPREIYWVKLNERNDFITRNCVDCLSFDAKEDTGEFRFGNPDWYLSNIRSFLNSAQEGWYTPTHIHDQAPSPYRASTVYTERPGFLHSFSVSEISSLVMVDEDLIWLPESDIFEEEVFKKKKLPKRPLSVFSWSKLYDPFMLKKGGEYISAAAKLERGVVYCDRPIRPICRICGDCEVSPVPNIGYAITKYVKANEAVSQIVTFSNEALLELFGMI